MLVCCTVSSQAGREVIDSVVTVTDAEAIDMSRRLGRAEGILSGISGGGTIAAALKVAEKAPKGSVILAMISDTGERYMSTALFDGIDATSDPEPNTSAAEVPSGNSSS
jgi:cysteine synthase